jgi:membrane protein
MPDRGRRAERPAGVPPRGWWDIARRVGHKVRTERVPLAAAGVAFYAMLAMFPAVIGLVSLYGLFADPARLHDHLTTLTAALPQEAGDLIAGQMIDVVLGRERGLTGGFVASLLLFLLSASAGMHGLMQALSIAHNEPEDRSFLRRRGIALALTVGAVLFFTVALGVIVAVPLAMRWVGLGEAAETALRLARWPLLAVLLAAALAVVYRYAPNRAEPTWRWVSWGSGLAVGLWLTGSAAFSIYVENFGRYNETYGALGAGIVILLWLFLSALVVLLGAMVNAELEHQTIRDTTAGPHRPLGDRGAYVADHVAPAPD